MQNLNYLDQDLKRKDSITSQKLGLSVRDDSIRIDKSLTLSKKITLNRFLLNKLLSFFNNLITNLDISQESKKTMFNLIDLVKTESDNFTVEQNFENDIISEYKCLSEKLNVENEILKKNQIQLTIFNTELTEQINNMRSELNLIKNENFKNSEEIDLIKKDKEKIFSDLFDAEIQIRKLQKENKLLKNKNNLVEITEYETENKDVMDFKEKEEINNTSNKEKCETTSYDNKKEIEVDFKNLTKFSTVFIQTPKLLNMTSYFLGYKDYFNFKLTSSKINTIMNKNYNFIINQLKSAIVDKNKKIENKNIDSDYGHLVSTDNFYIETLLKEYLQSDKIPGINLKNKIIEDLKFLENDVIKPLGINMPKQEKRQSFFATSFAKLLGLETNSSNSNSSTRKSIIFSEDPNLIESDLLSLINNENKYPLYISFDYSNRDEINGLLTSYLLGNFSNNAVSSFISNVMSNYSDLLYISYNTLKEIRELDIVKHALHYKLKKLRKMNTDLEAEIDDLKRFSDTNKIIKEILIKQKNEVEIKYNDSISQIINYKEELINVTNKFLGLTDKYNKIELEYEGFKNKLIKEFKILKHQYDKVCEDRDTVKDALFEFKQYFTRFNITEEGDIIYIDQFN